MFNVSEKLAKLSLSPLEARLVAIYYQLLSISDYSPTFFLNRILSELVNLVINSRGVVISPTLNVLKRDFRFVCNKAENELERYWLDRFLTKEILAKRDLEEFPYYQNYVDLVTWEYGVLEKYLEKKPNKILFVGGGLPMTAMILAEKFEVEIDCIDIDEELVNKTQEIGKKLSVNSLNILCADFYALKDLSKYDVVIVAALVADQKAGFEPVFSYLSSVLTRGQTVLCRYAVGLAEIFYADLSDRFLNGFGNISRHDPKGKIINSFLLAKRK